MANNVIIRKATKDYVCDVCGHIIKAGTEYLDRAVLNNGKCVQHERYHDECPQTSSTAKLFHNLEQNNCDLIAANKKTGDKIHVVGIYYCSKGSVVLYHEWASSENKKMMISELKNYHDCNGNDLI